MKKVSKRSAGLLFKSVLLKTMPMVRSSEIYGIYVADYLNEEKSMVNDWIRILFLKKVILLESFRLKSFK